MSSTSDNIPSPAPHEDALASARAAVIEVLTNTAEQRDQILQTAADERDRILSGAEAEATSILDQARGSAVQVREQAEAEAERIRAGARREAEDILNESRGASERIRGDADADAHRIRTEAEAEGEELRGAAVAIADDVRFALAELRTVESRLSDLSMQNGTDGETESQAATIELGSSDAGAAEEIVAPATPAVLDSTAAEPPTDTEAAPDLSSDEFDGFIRQLAERLDDLDRARSTGDRDEVGRVLHDLGDLANRSHAAELAELARGLGPDARPEELDDLIRQCYEVRLGQLSCP